MVINISDNLNETIIWFNLEWPILYFFIQDPPSGNPGFVTNKLLSTLISGDQLTMTCQISGGKPLVDSVNFRCGNKYLDQDEDSVKESYVSSSLSFNVEKDDDGLQCYCDGDWSPEAALYQNTDFVSLNVRCK